MIHRRKSRRKVTKDETRGKLVGVAWYSPSQWQQLREVAADVEQLEKTHQEWLVAAEQAFERLAESGIEPVKVPVDVQDLIGWCHERNVPVDAKARAQYVVEVLQKGSSAAGD